MARIIHFPMPDFQTIAHLIPNFDNRVDDPPAPIADQNTLHEIFGQLLGQSTAFIQPVLFKSGRLIVYAQAAVWGQHIQHRHDRLLQRCQAAGLHVSDIKVKVLPDTVSISHQQAQRPATYDTDKASAHLEKLATQLKKKELKDTIARLASRIRQNHKEEDE